MMRAYRALQLAVLTFALSSAPAAAQVPDSTRSRLRDLFGVADNRNWYLRVVTADDHQIEGNIGRESGDAVRVGSTLVSFESIRFVHRRRMEGGAPGGGAFDGGIAGGLLGLLTAGIACGISEGTCNTTMAFIGCIAVGTVFGAVVGGLAGSALNPGEPVWMLEWPVR
jgi:hypothetical protein